MQRLILHNLGPVKDCDIAVNDFMALTGPQASGKSTIAKAIFFFRTIKDDIIDMMARETVGEKPDSWSRRFDRRLRNKFIQLFGSSYGMPDDVDLKYYFNEDTWIRVYLTPNNQPRYGRNYIKIGFSKNIWYHFGDLDQRLPSAVGPSEREHEQAKLAGLFSDHYETVLIPAGRGMITLLTSQLDYIFTSMDQERKSRVDYCTRRYVELVLKLKPSFSGGIEELLSNKLHLAQQEFQVPKAEKMQKMIAEALGGRYRYADGEEKLYLGTKGYARYVKINFASSGQQEIVWVTNILFYYLVENRPLFLIFEEPESNLYPDTQKKMTELLSLFCNAGNQVLITTHSPHVLGKLNNLIYASGISAKGVSGVEKIIDRDVWLNKDSVSAWRMENGIAVPAAEGELGLIRNEDIDGHPFI